MRKSAFIIALLIPSFWGTVGIADFDWCGWQQTRIGDTTPQDYGSVIRAKFIFVGFDGVLYPEFTPTDSTLNIEDQPPTVEFISNWLETQSQGSLKFEPGEDNHEILLHPFENWDDHLDPPVAWMADLKPGEYLSPSASYLQKWTGENAGEANLETWHMGTSVSYLCSEILYKIYREYTNEGLPSPFGDFDDGGHGVAEEEMIDSLFFIFLTRESPFGNYGGTTWVEVNANAVFEFDDGAGLDFFGRVKSGPNNTTGEAKFQGTMQMHNTSELDEFDPDYSVGNAAAVFLHEFAHTLGFGEGPPALQGMNEDSLGRYYYGNLNISSQKYYPGHGVPMMSLANLERTDWVEVVDFTGQNLFDEEIYDLRLLQPGQEKGKIYKYRMEGHPQLPDQYFLFGYHSGMGIDVQGEPGQEYPICPNGLEVQHVVWPTGLDDPSIVDIESAFGLYQNIQHTEMPSGNSPLAFGQPAPPPGIWGFDNWDLWWVNDEPETLRERLELDDSWGDFPTYIGSPYDFFTTNEVLLPGGGTWSQDEFSFKTSPSGYWYSTQYDGGEGFSDSEFRFNDQDVPNPMFVQIQSQDDENHQMVVDFLSAPCERVTIDSGAYYQGVGETVFYSLTHTVEFEDYLTSYSIYLCPNQSGEPLILVDQVPMVYPNGLQGSFQIEDDFGTVDGEGGHLLFKFHNNITGLTGDIVSEAIHVDLNPVIYEDIVRPTSEEILFVGGQARVEWTDHFDDSLHAQVAVSYDVGNGPVPWASMAPEDPDWQVDPETSHGFSLLDVPPELEGTMGKVVLTFTDFASPPNLVNSPAAEGIRAVPLVGNLTDVSSSVFTGAEDFQGAPYAIVPIRAIGQVNERSGFALSLSLVGDQTDGKLYLNDSSPNSIIVGSVPVSAFPSGSEFEAGMSGLAVGDFDGDGDDDFFTCNPGTGPSPLFVCEGTEYSREFLDRDPNAPITNLASCAQWVDFDHDGDLDLHVGRISDNSLFGNPDALFQFNSSTGTFDWVNQLGDMLDQNTYCESLLWSDLNGDGYWEVFVSGSKGNMGLAVFSEYEEYDEVTSEYPFGGIKSPVVLAHNFNLDMHLDILIMNPNGPVIEIYYGDDGQFSVDNMEQIPMPVLCHQITVSDLDGDGWSDIVATTGVADDGTYVIKNLLGKPEYGQAFALGDDSVRLADVGECLGLLTMDIDGNGTEEVFAGLDDGTGGNRLWVNNGVSGYDQWLGIQLQSAHGAPPIGSNVYLFGQSGTLLGMQVFGAGGHGGQGPGDLIFRMESDQSPYTVHVDWPSRGKEVFSIPAANQYMTLQEENFWDLVEGSPSFEIVFGPMSLSWVFTWETDNWTPAEDDWVEFTPVSGCSDLVGESLIPGTTPGVSGSIEYQSDPDDGEATYVHRVVWNSAPCLPNCRISFTVHSGNQDLGEDSSEPQTVLVTKFCPLNY